ncbi:MAG: DNA polymerase Y family protein [Bacillota bacterium]
MKRIAFIEVRGLLCGGLTDVAPGANVVVKDGKVVDFSAEAGSAGVIMGIKERHARQACHWAAVAQYDEAVSRPVTDAFFELVTNISPIVEPVSETQVFADLTGLLDEKATLAAFAGALVPAMAFRVWIGIASSKLLAKAAVAGAQGGYTPGPLCRVTGFPGAEVVEVLRGAEAEYLAPLPPERLWRLDEATVSALESLGVTAIGQLARLPQSQLNRRFGPGGRLILDLARGIDPVPVRPLYPRRELEERVAFDAGTADSTVIAAALAQMATRLGHRLGRNLEGCRRLLLEVRAGPTAFHAARGFARPESSVSALRVALEVLIARLPITEPVTSLKVVAGDVQSAINVQPDLFHESVEDSHERAEARDRLGHTLEALKRKFSDRVITFGKDDEVPRRERMLALWDPFRSRRSAQCPESSIAPYPSNSTPTLPPGPFATAPSTR